MEPLGIVFTVLAAVLAVGIVVGGIAYRIVQKKRGRGGCGCGCDCCSGGCHACRAARKGDDGR